MAGASIELLSYFNNTNSDDFPGLSSNYYYSVELGKSVFFETNDTSNNLVGPLSNTFWGFPGSANGFRDLVGVMKDSNYYDGTEFAIYYEITNFSDNTIYFDTYLYANNTNVFDTLNAYSNANAFQVSANSSTGGYIGSDYFNVILNNNYSNYWFTFVTRGNDSNYAIKYEIITNGDYLEGDLDLELYKLKTISPDLYDDFTEGIFERGFNTGYSQAMEESSGTYQEGFEKGQEIGYQKAQKEETILTDTFEILHEGISAGSNLLNQKLTPNLTLGQVAFFPVTLTIVLFLIRSLVA